ncbi:MAG: 30S ribosomal protein S6 [Planctomycetota bacterium]|nr:MAG: 30S ribosomal protein S6 [Planctomycetota bacterium]
MNTYEAMLLLDNREVKNGWETLKEKVDAVLTKHGAKILVAKRWDERKLAYEIKKQKRATYYLAYIEADPQSLDQMSRSLKLSGPVLRHLLLRCEEVPEEAYEPEKEFNLEADDEGTEAVEGEGTEEGGAVESEDGAGESEGGAGESEGGAGESEGGEEQAEAAEAEEVKNQGEGSEDAPSAELGAEADASGDEEPQG